MFSFGGTGRVCAKARWPHVLIVKLTHTGHDAIAAIRNDTVCEKAKKAAVDHAVPLTVSALVELVKGKVRTRLGIGL